MDNASPLERVLSESKVSTFLFVQPGGNHGDFLIYLGMECLAKRLDLNFRTITAQEFLSNDSYSEDIIYLHGGGGYNNWCSGSALKILEHALRVGEQKVIQGPCSISDAQYIQEKMLPVLERVVTHKLIFFVREHTSLELCEEDFRELGVSVLLDQDTAFWTTPSALEALAGQTGSRYRLYALRQDNEVEAIKVSDFGRGVCLDPAYFCGSFEHWLKLHMCAKQIITSRTHSSILGALLGKPVVLYPSRYHKNKSVWDYSLKQLGVVWGPDQQKSAFLPKRQLRWLPGRIAGSYKVNQIVRWLQRVPLS